jgi:phosphatidylserine decarboxylase
MDCTAISAANDIKKVDDIPYNVAEWLPSDQKHIDRWINRFLQKIEDQVEHAHLAEMHHAQLHPVIRNFKQFIEDDPVVFMLFNQMFTQIPRRQRHTDPTGESQIRDYRIMLQVVNVVIATPPEFNKSSLVGFPINAILDWPMGTSSGYAAFLNEKVNMHLKAILNEWGKFLQSEASCSTLTEDPRHGWFGEDARTAMPTFDQDFLCDPSLPHRGFRSWDQFFTRQFRPGQRPIAFPNDETVVGHACESSPYRIASKVKRVDDFWVKAQRYSLHHMMGADSLVSGFIGGTVYQAFLSALCYHRWHSPVSGTIVKVRQLACSLARSYLQCL